MRPLLALLLVACTVEQEPKSPRVAEHEDVYQAELREAERSRAHHSTDPSTFGEQPSRASGPASLRAVRDTRRSSTPSTPPADDGSFDAAFDRDAEGERAARCSSEAAARQQRIAELEPRVTRLRAEREERERTRVADEQWVRSHCYWDNEPRTVYRLERAQRPGQYQFVERHDGFRAAYAKCPKNATPNQLRVATFIGNSLVDRNTAAVLENVNRRDEDEQAGVAEYEQLRKAEAECGAPR